jgi:SAM-dependent methyltransferase
MLDVGCGPGHVTAFLAGLGLNAAGLDLSEEMITQARTRHPRLPFGADVDVSFRFFDPPWLRAELEQAGFAVEALTLREPYPDAEVPTPRAYYLARAR